MEGLPSVIVGVLVLRLLPDRPREARWLAPAESAWLERTLEAERGAVASHGASLRQALTNPRVWSLGAVYFLVISGLYSFSLWLPQLVKASGGLSDFAVGLTTAVPYLVAAAGMVLVGASSDRSGERYLHLAGPVLVGAAGFVVVAFVRAPVPLVIGLSVVAFGVLACLGPFWALPTAFLKDQAGAGAIALINSMGAFGGFVGPNLLGVVKDRTGGFAPALLLLAAMLAAAAAIALGLRRADAQPKAA
jgi:ACS family tartrate transporter-like MFS transporter